MFRHCPSRFDHVKIDNQIESAACSIEEVRVIAPTGYIQFEPDDKRSPYNWSSGKKWTIMVVICAYTLLVSGSGAAYPQGIPGQMMSIPGHSSQIWLLGLVLFAWSTALAPLLFGPFSEVWGRKPVFLISCLFFGLFKIPVAVAKILSTILIGQFLSGIGTGVGNTLVGGIVVDLFENAEERDLPMATFILVVLVGTSLGQVAAAFVATTARLPGGPSHAWRWIHWLQLVWAVLQFSCFAIFVPETRASVILSERAARLRRETGDPGIHAQGDLERENIKVMMRVSLIRPLQMLLCEPIVISLSLYITLCWALLYLFIASVLKLFGSVYGFTGAVQSLPFLAVAVGSTLGWFLNFWQMRLYRTTRKRVGHDGDQGILLRARLIPAMPAGVLLAAALLLYAWTSKEDIHWIFPVASITLIFCAIFTILLAVFNGLSDCYRRYASSALSAQGFLRGMVGGALPLASSPLYDRLGFNRGTIVLALISAALALIPFVLCAKMQWIRSRSHFAGEILREEEEEEEEHRP